MNRFNLMYPAALAVLVAVLTAPVQAAVEAGKILYARGIVSIVDAQDSARGGASGSVLYEGERVITGRNALAQLRLSDGTLIALRGSSDYQIERQTFGADESLYEQAGKLFTGWMRSITGTIGSKYPTRVSQSTQVATIGIRGTVYQLIHIPEGGLPGYPGQEPGTYVYLESGSVEISSTEGTRLLHPGDVVFVPAAGGAPRLAPEKKQLFELVEDDAVAVVEGEGDLLSDLLNETITELFHAPGSPGAVGFIGSYLMAHDGHVKFSGEGNSRTLSYMAAFNGEYYEYYTANEGASALYSGGHLLSDGTQVNWGVWDPSSYQITDDFGGTYTPFSDWIWAISDNVMLDPTDVLSSGLSGEYAFNLVGGTALIQQGSTGPGDAALTGGQILLDFGTGAMSVNLQTTIDGSLSFSGSDTLSSFYSGGIVLAGSDATSSGTIQGVVVGSEANGIISAMDLSGSNDTYKGVAAFERDSVATVAAP